MTVANGVTNSSGSNTSLKTKQVFEVWREAKSGNGAMASFEWSDQKRCFFLSMAPQGGDGGKKFNFDAKINVKLGVQDLGEMLLVLNGRKEGCGRKNDKGYWSGLFHENDSGSKVIDFSYTEQYGFGLGLSSKVNNSTDPAVKIRLNLSPGEAEVLRVFFEAKLPLMLVQEYTSR